MKRPEIEALARYFSAASIFRGPSLVDIFIHWVDNGSICQYANLKCAVLFRDRSVFMGKWDREISDLWYHNLSWPR